MKNDWNKLDHDRLAAAQREYDAGVTDDANPTDCDGCKFWSELCARSIGCGPMEALCLNPDSPQYQRMVSGGCENYVRGRAIDDPSR